MNPDIPVQPDIAATTFRALAEPARVRLLNLLIGGEKAVGELHAVVGGDLSRVSRHLACLRDAGLVTSRREGQRVLYRIASPRILDLLTLGERMRVSA